MSCSRSATAHVLVDLVDGLGEEAELDHRAECLDEARVGRAAVGGERRREPGDLAHRLAQQRVERPRLGEEGLARRLEVELVIEAVRLERTSPRAPAPWPAAVSAECRSLKRMLNCASALTGMTLVVGLPTSMLVTSKFDGEK